MGGTNSTAEEPGAEKSVRDNEPLLNFKLHVLKFIFDNGGVVPLATLCHQNLFEKQLSAKQFLESNPQLFFLEQVTEDNCEVRAHTNAGVCYKYEATQEDCSLSDCSKFHICKHFVTGSCKFGQRCKKSHQLRSSHNQEIIKRHQLHELDDDIILQLLKPIWKGRPQAKETKPEQKRHEGARAADKHDRYKGKEKDESKFPEKRIIPAACFLYNSPEGCGRDECTFLHVCSHFIKDNCKFSANCKYSHNILDPQPKKVLSKFGYDVSRKPGFVIRLLRQKNIVDQEKKQDKSEGDQAVDADAGGQDDNKKSSSRSGKKKAHTSNSSSMSRKEYICVFHLGGLCNYGDKCFKLHSEEPFQWQFKEGNGWKNFGASENIEIEQAFCNCKSEVSVDSRNAQKPETLTVVFDYEKFHIRSDLDKGTAVRDVRRLAPQPERDGWKKAVSTTWHWHWKDDNDQFVEYGKESGRGTTSAINSTSLEEAYAMFISGNHDKEIEFGTGKFHYKISLKNMTQTNVSVGTVREVARRPEFVRQADVNQKAKRFKDLSPNTTLPDTWNGDALSHSSRGFQLCSVTTGSIEYIEVETRFKATVTDVTFVSIERVQNMELWDDFCRKRSKMENKSDNKIQEELLFHGTTENVIAAICQQNFDCRLSGTRVGAKFGQGAYFHKEFRYSNKYAQPDTSGQKRIFLVRVLVGEYAQGIPEFRRPPPKDPKNAFENFFDSCVDDPNNPGIFVVFENHQVYPEYIITYR